MLLNIYYLYNVRVYLEQNPDTGSNWAKMAQEGHKIMWVIKGRRYLAQVRDHVVMKGRRYRAQVRDVLIQ